MHRVLTVSTVLGLIGVLQTFGMLLIGKDYFHMDIAYLQTLIFLKLAIAGHLTLFITRTRKPFFRKPYPSAILLWSAILTKAAATLFVVYPMGQVPSITWGEAGAVWIYCILWIFIEDWAKIRVYKHLELKTPRHQDFIALTQKKLGPST
ncbi:membrane protein of unknown function [Acidithiobacillus ferrivorans]|uniref:Cation-transporting P-type ATPase C-terminal domain-containing protein n=1 Tax=Acidithiobacillus ferrivorans TaxID=160808 RepID=A0A060UR98_9PROT|nr:hypothetical protein [Acidithiobacillus ferrivorans]CDQ09069.1 membrane hypothetical protein [Acidithiobacillus ferrivorans]SMH66601.1 membrane protein of unknown function [Acidithiobacillus ferrivorans]